MAEVPEFKVKIEPSDDPVEQLKEGLSKLKETLSLQIELQMIGAKITHAKFEALVAEGFTPEQALLLVK